MTKPKNGVTDAVILADFGYGYYLPAIWSPADGLWVAAIVQASDYEGEIDCCFENERFKDEEIVKWRSFPD